MLRCIWILASMLQLATAFCPMPSLSQHVSASTTSLSVAPPMIISGFIKKMREKDEKAKMPMADPGEAANEAKGLRVGKGAWKWPPVWPYDANIFMPSIEAEAKVTQDSMKNMMSVLSGGMSQLPTGKPEQEQGETTKFQPLEYWKDQPNYELDPEAAAKLTAHFEFYLRDGLSILELGAGKDSYLGKLKPSRHVGISASMDAMEDNPSLTEKFVVDLNHVVPDRDVDSDDLRRLASDPFDAVIMVNTIPFLSSPREVFRSAWYLLKPGGIMLVAFPSKEFSKNQHPEAQVMVWKQYNDDQHMWITGSFFQFSAGDGWESLKGFDISPESAKSTSGGDNPISTIMNRGKDNNMFVVQAMRAYQDDAIDPNNPERSIQSLTWMLPVLESRDKKLVVPRLARAYQLAVSADIREAIERNVQHLPAIYEALVKMDQFSFTFSMQAQLAADLVSDPDFNASQEQMLAMRQGLGLRPPSTEFWLPVGKNTAAMIIEDKINLLAYIVPRFGSGNPEQEDALQAFVTALKPTYAVIRAKCPELPESDVQLLGTELLAAEILPVGVSTREEFAIWLAALSADEMREILSIRKSFQAEAKVELAQYKQARKEEAEAREEYKRVMNEQVEKARKERSLIFNPRTQKMEVFKVKK